MVFLCYMLWMAWFCREIQLISSVKPCKTQKQQQKTSIGDTQCDRRISKHETLHMSYGLSVDNVMINIRIQTVTINRINNIKMHWVFGESMVHYLAFFFWVFWASFQSVDDFQLFFSMRWTPLSNCTCPFYMSSLFFWRVTFEWCALIYYEAKFFFVQSNCLFYFHFFDMGVCL